MKRVLIIGKSSYIGKSMFQWLLHYPNQYEVDIVSARNQEWKEKDFTQFDTIVDLAGIAHINHITDDMETLFYAVNRDLTVEIGKYAKAHGIKHMIYFSSMNVYGDFCGEIVDRSAVHPTSFYGNSKLQGDLGLEALEDDSFVVSHIRPPFVYGKGCSGNYNTISKIAKLTPIFPDFHNRKSMIYIDNLCEFVRLVIDSELGGYLTPQNRELVSTSDLVREIAKHTNKRVWFTKLFNGCIVLGNKLTRQVRRAFADDCCNLLLSDYFDWKYCVVDFPESIRRTECVQSSNHQTV